MVRTFCGRTIDKSQTGKNRLFCTRVVPADRGQRSLFVLVPVEYDTVKYLAGISVSVEVGFSFTENCKNELMGPRCLVGRSYTVLGKH